MDTKVNGNKMIALHSPIAVHLNGKGNLEFLEELICLFFLKAVWLLSHLNRGFPGGASGKEPACHCRRHKRCGLISGSGRSLGEGNGNPFQYSFLENPMGRGAWRATVHRVAKSQRLK